MRKQLIATIIILMLIGQAASSTINQNTGTQASASITLDRPWYTSIQVYLDENLNGFLQFIPDTWSWIVDALFIHEDQEENAQVIGKSP